MLNWFPFGSLDIILFCGAVCSAGAIINEIWIAYGPTANPKDSSNGSFLNSVCTYNDSIAGLRQNGGEALWKVLIQKSSHLKTKPLTMKHWLLPSHYLPF